MSFGWDTKSRWSLLSGVYAKGSKRSHQSALEMCNLSWTPQYNSLNHSCVSPNMGCLELWFGVYRTKNRDGTGRAGVTLGSHPRPSGHMQLDITWDAGSCRKRQTKWFAMMVNVFFALIHFWTLLPWWIFYTSADLLLFVLLSTVKFTTMWPHHSHNIVGLPLFLWHCRFSF